MIPLCFCWLHLTPRTSSKIRIFKSSSAANVHCVLCRSIQRPARTVDSRASVERSQHHVFAADRYKIKQGKRHMNWFRNLKVGMKLTAAFAVLLALCGFLGVFAVSQMAKMNGTMEDIATNAIASMRELGEMRDACNQVRRSQLSLMILKDESLRSKEQAKENAAMDQVKEHATKYEASIDSAKEKQLYEDFQRAWADYLHKSDELAQALKDKHNGKTEAAKEAASQAFHAAFDAMQQDTKLNDDGAEQSRQG